MKNAQQPEEDDVTQPAQIAPNINENQSVSSPRDAEPPEFEKNKEEQNEVA